MPGAPPQPMPGMGGLGGPLGPFGAAGHMGGLPHGIPPGMLKAPPPEMHREDMKGPLGQVADDRLVRIYCKAIE